MEQTAAEETAEKIAAVEETARKEAVEKTAGTEETAREEEVEKMEPKKVTDRERAVDGTERWGIFELTLEGPRDGNPFVDVELSAEFTQGERVVKPQGFYDGEGVYRVRFMPDALGEWSYVTKSNRPELDGKTGKLTCVEPSPGNHGPVRVWKKYYLAYADGTQYFQVGTTCYTWVHREKELEEKTLATLKDAPFNKIRFGVFPNHYGRPASSPEPQMYPFEGKLPKDWDFTRFNPEYFRHFERRVGDLRDLGIEADVIVFHPYDRWGFRNMGAENDDRYLRYVIARLAAYRNVWWSMANEFDLIKTRKDAGWDRLFQITRDSDPYGRLRSIHNCGRWYDHTKPWVTHCSIQSGTAAAAVRGWREKYGKPVVVDECQYEGDPKGPHWGRLTAQQMAERFWTGAVGGGYVGHSEIKIHPDDLVWVTRGYILRGQSPPRIAFFKKIMEEGPPFEDMEPVEIEGAAGALLWPGVYYLVYFQKPAEVTLTLTGTRSYRVEGIDTWGMTVTPMGRAEPGEFSFTPPKGQYALRLSAYAPGEKLPPPPAKIHLFSASPSAVMVGKSVALSWNAVDATSVRLDGAAVPAEGSKTVSPRKTTTYTLEVNGEGGPKSREITVPVIDPNNLHLRINCGPAGVDVAGWQSDDEYASGGEDYDFGRAPDTAGVANAAPRKVYRTCRHGDHSYSFPMVLDGEYVVRLHFYDQHGEGRKMDYTIEGKKVLEGFAPPAGVATVREFTVKVTGGNGLRIVAEKAGGNDVFESGIEIIGSGSE